MKISDYDKKFACLYIRQGGQCAISGKLLIYSDKVDFHHILANKRYNQKLYKRYIDSVWNLLLVDHGAHLNGIKPAPPPEWQIKLAEGVLAVHPDIAYEMDMEEAIRKHYS